MRFHQMIAAVALSLGIASPVLAAGGRNQADQLPTTNQLAKSRAAGTGDSVAEQRHRQEVQRLLNRLEAGEPVNPADVERVLRDSLED